MLAKILEVIKKFISLLTESNDEVVKEIEPIKEPERTPSGVEILEDYMGINEEENKDVIDMLWSEYGRPDYDHSTPWCGLAVAIGEVESGYLTLEELPKKYETSRRWLTSYPKEKYDLIKDVTQLQESDIVVRWRGSKESWQGHVAYFAGWDNDGGFYKDGRYKKYLAKGGNQSDSFSITPCHAYMFLGALRRKA